MTIGWFKTSNLNAPLLPRSKPILPQRPRLLCYPPIPNHIQTKPGCWILCSLDTLSTLVCQEFRSQSHQTSRLFNTSRYRLPYRFVSFSTIKANPGPLYRVPLERGSGLGTLVDSQIRISCMGPRLLPPPLSADFRWSRGYEKSTNCGFSN